MWGQYYEQNRKGGEPPSTDDVLELVRLFEEWRNSASVAEREKIWLRMLAINADDVYTIGIVTRALQPIVVRDNLRNVPVDGVYSWDPGAYLGMYRPDTFWIDTAERR
jgi:peptide/nickel transport system substrate-binding protein